MESTTTALDTCRYVSLSLQLRSDGVGFSSSGLLYRRVSSSSSKTFNLTLIWFIAMGQFLLW